MEIRWIVFVFVAPIVIVLSIAAVAKYIEVWRARSWVAARGRVTRSKPGVRERRRPSGSKLPEDPELVNVPDIAYAFDVGDRRYTGTRISLGEDNGESDIAGTLARYAVGREVTVYYNKDNPDEAVLEREPPRGLFAAVAWLIALLTTGAILAGSGIVWIESSVRDLLPNPAASPMVIMLLVMAGFVLLIGRVLRMEAADAKGWHATTGTIADVQYADDGVSVPRFAYVYTVNGLKYAGQRAAFGGQTTTRVFGKVIDARIEKYPPGSQVTVFYDPKNPAKSVLERRVEGLLVIRLIAAALLLLALFVAKSKAS